MGIFGGKKKPVDDGATGMPVAQEQQAVDAPKASGKGLEGAAQKIEAIQRGKAGRKVATAKAETKKQQGNAATKIAAIQRGKHTRADVKSGYGAGAVVSTREALCAAASERVTALIASFEQLLKCGCLANLGVKPPKKPLSQALEAKLREMFKAIDANGDGSLEKQEAIDFYGKNFAKVNAQAMFNEVDIENSGQIRYEHWISFWQNVMAQGLYSEEQVLEELAEMMEGGSWVDWNDGRTT